MVNRVVRLHTGWLLYVLQRENGVASVLLLMMVVQQVGYCLFRLSFCLLIFLTNRYLSTVYMSLSDCHLLLLSSLRVSSLPYLCFCLGLPFFLNRPRPVSCFLLFLLFFVVFVFHCVPVGVVRE